MRGSPAPESYPPPPATRAPLKKDPQEGLPGGEAHRGLDPGNRGGRPTPQRACGIAGLLAASAGGVHFIALSIAYL